MTIIPLCVFFEKIIIIHFEKFKKHRFPVSRVFKWNFEWPYICGKCGMSDVQRYSWNLSVKGENYVVISSFLCPKSDAF